MATADFDGDGLLDVVVANNGSDGFRWNGIALLRGLFGGGFADPTFPTPLVGANSVAAADLNRDGKMDLIVVEPYDLIVLLGLGDGTFAQPQHYSAGTSPQFLAVGDFNGDGWPDLAVTNFASLALLTNVGDGTFGAPTLIGPLGQSKAILVGDFNRDGKLDIYVALYAPTGALFLGNGDGTFPSIPIVVDQGSFALFAISGDFNRDGNADLAFIGSSLLIAYGRGDGSFDPAQSVASVSGSYASSLAAADFNGDGWPDLIASGYFNTVVVALSDGAGGFLPPRSYVSGPTPGALLAADFDRDGIPDAAVVNFDSNTMTLFRGRPDGSLEATPSLAASASALAKADFDGNGKSDLVAGGTGISIWLGDGTGGFQPSYTNNTPTDIRAVAAADLRGNGKMDVVAVSTVGFFPTSGKLWVFLGDGAGGASPLPVQDLDFPPNDLWTGDLDGDGVPDLVISGIGKISVLHGLGNGTFSSGVGLGSGSGLAFGSLVVQDLSGDGKLDIAAAQYANARVTVFLGNGNGTFGTPADYLLNANPFALVAGDFTGDGNTDLLTANLYSNFGLSLLRGSGVGTFEPSISFPGPPFLSLSMVSADLTGDGKLDIVLGDGGSADLLMMTGKGDGTFSAFARFATAGAVGRILTGDWNGDGKLDLAVANGSGVFILLNTNCSARRLGVVTQPGTCAAPSTVLQPQPVIGLFDDGDNLLPCGSGSVSASLVAGEGTPTAVLGGTKITPLENGTAPFTDLFIDLAGVGYELEFSHPVARSVRSRPVTVQDAALPSAAISSSSSVCPNSSGNSASVSASGAGATYSWGITNGTITSGAGTRRVKFTAGGSGSVQLSVTVSNGCSAEATKGVTIVSEPGCGLAMPAITAPGSGAMISVSGVTFSWGTVSGAAGYDLRVFDAPTGATLFSGSLLGSTSTSELIALPNGNYVFAVRACVGRFSDSTCGPFRTRGFGVGLTAPAWAPTVTAPGAGANLTSSTQTFSWTAVPKADGSQPLFYEVFLKDVAAGKTELQIKVPDPTLSTTYSLHSSTQYRLQVRACQAGCGPYSSPVLFSASLAPVPSSGPTVTSAVVSGGNSLAVAWSAVSGADIYRVYVVEPTGGPGGGALTVAARQVSTTSVTVPVPSGFANIVVQACTGDGCGPFGPAFGITPAGPNPAAPNLGTPVAGTVVVGPVVSFSWSRVPGDTGSNTIYRLYVQDLSRQAAALDVYTTQNFYAAYFKAEGTRYDGVVIANPGPSQVQGPASGFNVRGASAASPTMASPGHQSSVSQGNIQLGWTPVPGSTLYEYFVAVQGQPNATVTGVTPGLFVQTPLPAVGGNPTVYSGITRACPAGNGCAIDSDSGWGPWSNAPGGPGVTNFTVTP